MKSIITNTDESMELINQISQFDHVSMTSIICTLIDIVSVKSKEPVAGILERICDAVIAAQELLGPYQPDKKGES